MIAVVSFLGYHYECLGCLGEIFLARGIGIDVFGQADLHGDCSYYQHQVFVDTAFRVQNVKNLFRDPTTMLGSYDLILKLTEQDEEVDRLFSTVLDRGGNLPPIVSIAHVTPENRSNNDNSNVKKRWTEYFLTLTDFVFIDTARTPRENVLHGILPIYRAPTTTTTTTTTISSSRTVRFPPQLFSKPMLLFVGYYPVVPLTQDKDLMEMVHLCRSQFNVVVCSPNAPSAMASRHRDNFYSFRHLPTEAMAYLVSRSKFLLGRRTRESHRDRFSGAIALSISFGKPMVLNDYYAASYDFPAISLGPPDSYVHTYVSRLSRMTASEYATLEGALLAYRATKLTENRQRMFAFLAAKGILTITDS
jgi:hypothetical protein